LYVMMNSDSGTREWDAPAYARAAAPIESLGRTVIPRLELRGDETVLDAGCGRGGVTAALLEELPHGRVIAVDGSAAMVAAAREHLAAWDDAVEVRQSDLLDLELDAPVDAVLSTATFHWIADHDRLFARMHAALGPSGRFAAQCGGAGNIARVVAAIADVDEPALRGWDGPWHYAAPEDTEARLRAAGFIGVRAWLQDAPIVPDDSRSYLRAIILGSHLERLAPERREPFVDAVLARLSRPLTLDYVRLNLIARRPGD
jgi:trans-aconitate 2-methyltransferase